MIQNNNKKQSITYHRCICHSDLKSMISTIEEKERNENDY